MLAGGLRGRFRPNFGGNKMRPLGKSVGSMFALASNWFDCCAYANGFCGSDAVYRHVLQAGFLIFPNFFASLVRF